MEKMNGFKAMTAKPVVTEASIITALPFRLIPTSHKHHPHVVRSFFKIVKVVHYFNNLVM